MSPDGLPGAVKGKRQSLGRADCKTERGDSSCGCDQNDKCGKVTIPKREKAGGKVTEKCLHSIKMCRCVISHRWLVSL